MKQNINQNKLQQYEKVKEEVTEVPKETKETED